MKNHIAHRNIATAAFFLVMFSIGSSLFAQTPLRMSIPGSAFSREPGSGKKVVVEDVAGGRRFRGEAGAQVILGAVLPRPASGSADHKIKMQRIVVHFRTSRVGPSLRSVRLIGSNHHMETYLKGDYITKEITKPSNKANAWTLIPASVTAIHLEVVFPIGFDSPINPGEFFLSSVDMEFATPLPPTKVPTNIDLAKSSGCMNCHTVDQKLVGPALKDIAAKYKGDAGAQARLEEKVKKGSKGAWGSIQMPPNTNVRDADIKTLVQFILSLK